MYGFGLALAAGFALMGLCLYMKASKAGLPRAAAFNLMLWAIPLSVIMGRLIFCLFRRSTVFYDMVDGHFLGIAPLFKVWEGGFNLPGLLAGMLIAVPLAAKASKVKPADLADWAAPPAALVMVFAHLGAILAGEGYGEILENPALYTVQNTYGEWHVAVFAFEAAVYLVLFILLMRAHCTRPGGKALALIIAYGALQLFLESLHRDNYLRLEINGFIRVNQLLCLALLVYGLVRLTRLNKGPALQKRNIFHFILLALTALFVIGAEFYEKLPLPTLLLYALSALSCLTLTLVAGQNAMQPKQTE